MASEVAELLVNMVTMVNCYPLWSVTTGSVVGEGGGGSIPLMVATINLGSVVCTWQLLQG